MIDIFVYLILIVVGVAIIKFLIAIFEDKMKKSTHINDYFEGAFDYDENDIDVAMRTHYEVRKVMNISEGYLYKNLIGWISQRRKNGHIGEKILAQVPLGAYLSSDDSDGFRIIQHKRPDFTIVDQKNFPLCVVEFNGKKHNQGNALERDKVKAAALRNANIPLVIFRQGDENKYDVISARMNEALSTSRSFASDRI